MTFIDLCAGIGGFSLGLEQAGMICKGQVENNEYCNRILAKHWPHVPRWGDIKLLNPACLPAVDLICGGYPCQPFSLSGLRKGEADDRHLWPFFIKIIAHLRPAWCVLENVAGHISMGLDTVLSDLEGEGYAAVPVVIPACAVGGGHRRDRVWTVANTTEPRPQNYSAKNGNSNKLYGFRFTTPPDFYLAAERIYGLPDSPDIRRGDGVPFRVDRIRACGNAVVPQLVCEIGRHILAAEGHKDVP